jgi:hypothetical protein
MGGATVVQPPNEWYVKHWPKITRGPMMQESRNLLIAYCEKKPDRWEKLLTGLKQIQ